MRPVKYIFGLIMRKIEKKCGKMGQNVNIHHFVVWEIIWHNMQYISQNCDIYFVAKCVDKRQKKYDFCDKIKKITGKTTARITLKTNKACYRFYEIDFK